MQVLLGRIGLSGRPGFFSDAEKRRRVMRTPSTSEWQAAQVPGTLYNWSPAATSPAGRGLVKSVPTGSNSLGVSVVDGVGAGVVKAGVEVVSAISSADDPQAATTRTTTAKPITIRTVLCMLPRRGSKANHFPVGR